MANTDEAAGDAHAAQDVWARWLLDRRDGGDEAKRQASVRALAPVRDLVLDNARVRPGDTVLDVGCGDGLIAFGALDRVGPTGRVIFSDISQDLLGACEAMAREMGREPQCAFVRAAADDLSALPDASVDVVTTRSVLIYVQAKPLAFREFFRVLKPGGRLSIFEPINRFSYPESEGRFEGYDVAPVLDLAQKVLGGYARCSQVGAAEAMLDFGERDLLTFAERAGFVEVRLEARYEIVAYPVSRTPLSPIPDPVPEEQRAAQQTGQSWESFLRSSPNPLAPTLEEAMAATLTREEAERFTARLRPLVESGEKATRSEVAYLWAVKHAR